MTDLPDGQISLIDLRVVVGLRRLKAERQSQRRKTDFASRFNDIAPAWRLRLKFSLSEFRKMCIFGLSRARLRGASRSSRVLGAGCDGRVGACDERG
jgi:hypothetical protein